MITSFISPGMIDYRAITTAGASIKEGENPIGFFGTGLKYAIAIILRNGGKINIYRGLEKLEFTSKDVVIRGKTFQVACMNGKEMGFTTELGKTWVMWQAFREIYCNTLDEKGRMELGVLKPQPGHTLVVVEQQEFEQCAKEKENYVLERKPFITTEPCEFHDFVSPRLHYRKVQVKEMHKDFRFTPNLKSQLDLTEDRTIKAWWDAQAIIGEGVCKSTNESFIEDWLLAGENYIEHTVGIRWCGSFNNSLVEKVALRLFKDPVLSKHLNSSAKAYCRQKVGDAEAVACELFPAEAAILAESIAWCRKLQYTVDEYPIVVAETLGENVLGEAHVKKRKIFLARRAIQQGKLCCAATLIEEWCHIKHGHGDCSRAMQNWLFEQLTVLGESYLMSKPQ